MFLGISNLPRRLHQVFLINVFPVRMKSQVRTKRYFYVRDLPLVSDGKHPRFRDDVTKIGAIEAIG